MQAAPLPDRLIGFGPGLVLSRPLLLGTQSFPDQPRCFPPGPASSLTLRGGRSLSQQEETLLHPTGTLWTEKDLLNFVLASFHIYIWISSKHWMDPGSCEYVKSLVGKKSWGQGHE